jgi:hypothetical protein
MATKVVKEAAKTRAIRENGLLKLVSNLRNAQQMSGVEWGKTYL